MSRPQQGSLRAWALGVSVIVALGSIGVLTYEAVGLDRSHRAVAEGVLRDYSAFAADQFSRLATERVHALTRTLLEPVACGLSPEIRQSAAADRTAAARASAMSCANPAAINGFFEADRVTGHLVFTTGAVEGSVREAVSRLPMEGALGFGLIDEGGHPLLVGYWNELVPGAPQHVVGFVAPAAIVQTIFDDIVLKERLLPGSLTEAAQNREYLNVDVRDTSGRSLYRSGPSSAAFATERPVGSPRANMQVRLAINEAAASRLIIGGVPQSRLPLLMSLLAIAVGLLAIGVWQVQRERRLARMRVDFVRSASHELRTPLAQIRLFTETLQLGRVRSWSEVVRSLAFVDQQSRRLSRLVENLLTFAHGGQQRRANLESIDLPAFLAEISTGFQPVAEALGQKLRRVEGADMCVARADREWLTQIVLNLLDNAAKYGPAGQTITLSAERDDQHARVVVEDQGPGIPSADRERIFAPFVRLSREHEERTGGTGIGLAVSADLAAAMHGRIWAAEARHGARFVIALPAVEPSEAHSLVA
jgi:signal transduction histidine kinase